MKIDHLSTALDVENDVESHYNVKYIIVPAIFANVIMPRRHVQYGGIDDLHWTTVYLRVFLNFSVKWSVWMEYLRGTCKTDEGLVNKLEISTRYVNCSVKTASNSQIDSFLCPPFPYFYCLIDNFSHIFKSSNFRGVATHIYRYPGQKSLKNHNFEPLWSKWLIIGSTIKTVKCSSC